MPELIDYVSSNYEHQKFLLEVKSDDNLMKSLENLININKFSKLISVGDSLVGIVLITKPYKKMTSIRYGILKPYRKQGLGSTSLELACNFIFDNLNCESIILQIDKSNVTSMNRALECGFDVDDEAPTYGDFLEYYKLNDRKFTNKNI